MNEMAWTYLAYLGISIGITVWVARTLRHYGAVLLIGSHADQPERTELADATSHLLVVGFYLVNLGIICFSLKSSESVMNTQASIELLSTKVGTILVVLGVMHFLVVAACASHGKTEGSRPASRRDRPTSVDTFLDPEPRH